MALFAVTDTFAYIGLDEKIHRVDGNDVRDMGLYSGSIAYQPNDVMMYGDMLFIALVAVQLNVPPTSIVDDNWSSFVRFSGQALPTPEETYIIAVSGSLLAWNTWGSLVRGDWLQNKPDVVGCTHIDWGTAAAQVNAGQMPYNDTYASVQAALDALFYVPLQVTSFGNTVGIVELGQSVLANNLTWVYNKSVVSQSIDQGIGALPAVDRSVAITGVWTTDQVYHLTASDGTVSASATTSLVFRQKRYWGPSSNPAIDDAGVIALSQEFATGFSQSRTVVANAEYIYFAFPSGFGTPTFTVNGLLNTAWSLTTRTFVNASGLPTSYDIWRSDNLLTGTYQIILS